MVKEVDIIYKIGDSVTLHQGDCIETMRTLPDNSVDSIVTDPPYELGFMNKSWDSTGIANNVEMWKECLRVLKPGGHLLSFGGTRTYHRMTCAIEDAGFEIRDQMQWLYGSGFPKSMNIGKAIKAVRETGGSSPRNLRKSRMGDKYHPTGQVDYRKGRMFSSEVENDNTQEVIDNGWGGWGTCLKPANEPICLARKPISEKTVAGNVLKWGTGGLNIDACRIGSGKDKSGGTHPRPCSPLHGGGIKQRAEKNCDIGRFPANIILDGKAGEILDTQSGTSKSTGGQTNNALRSNQRIYGKGVDNVEIRDPGFGDVGGASRFFYCPKASKSERGEGNSHPTVKPVKLIEYLVKLVTPPQGIVLDPFMGSGTTGVAAKNLGHRFIGIDMDEGYCEIAEKRISAAQVAWQQLALAGCE